MIELCFAQERRLKEAMERLTDAQKNALIQAAEDAAAPKASPILLRSAPNGEGEFDSKEHDVFLSFDYNKAPDIIDATQEAQLRFIMQVVQSQGTNALSNASKNLTHDSEAWISFFTKYPLLFNFQSRNSKTYHEDDFTLSGSIGEATKFVKEFLGYSCPLGIALNLISAIQSASGPVLKTQSTQKNLQYLALCRGYDKASTLTIYRAQLNMKINDVKAVCINTRNIALDISYDEVVLEMNNTLALALYPMLSQQASEIAAKYLGSFFKQFAETAYQDFEKYLKSL